jgi:hypothetical protein
MKSIVCSLTISIALTAGAGAGLIVVGATKDNTLYDDPTGSLSNAQGPTLFAGNTGGNATRRGLIQFSLSAVPTGAIVDSVTVSLYLQQSLSTPVNVGLHRVLQDWGEGTSATGFRGGGGAGSTAGDATWIHTFYSGSLWDTPGGDFAATASASTSVDAEGVRYFWGGTPAIVADVQGWLDAPAANFGWLVKGDETQGGTAKAFGTREISNTAHQPSLTIEYHLAPIPEPGTAGVGLALGLVGILGRRRAARA